MRFMIPVCTILMLVAVGCTVDTDLPSSSDSGPALESDGLLKKDMPNEDVKVWTPDISYPDCKLPPVTYSGNLGNCSNYVKIKDGYSQMKDVEKHWKCQTETCGVTRMACKDSTSIIQEVRCNSNNDCECRITENGKVKVRTCPVAVYSGRFGCSRCKEVILENCCKDLLP